MVSFSGNPIITKLKLLPKPGMKYLTAQAELDTPEIELHPPGVKYKIIIVL